MAIKDSFLQEIKIGDMTDIISNAQEISGMIISLDLENVRIKLESGIERTIPLESISYYEIEPEIDVNPTSEKRRSLEVEAHSKSDEGETEKTPIESVGFCARTYNSLHRSGNNYLEDLDGRSASDLLKIRNLGKKGVAEIIQKCEEYGIITGIGFENI